MHMRRGNIQTLELQDFNNFLKPDGANRILKGALKLQSWIEVSNLCDGFLWKMHETKTHP